MTTAEVLGVVRRRWYLVAAGVLLTAAVAALVLGRSGVYVTRVDVVLLPPPSAAGAPEVVGSSEDLIAAAGLLERLVNAGRETNAATSQQVPLEGTGVRDGVLVTLPNNGGQWDYNFTSPMLSLQVAGPSRDAVLRDRAEAVRDINRTLAELQREQGAPASRMLTTHVVPEDAQVAHVTGHPARAAGATAVVGLAVTLLLTVLADHLLLRRRGRAARSAVAA